MKVAPRHRDAVVVAFAVVLAIGAALLLTGPLRGEGVAHPVVSVPWYLLAPLFALTELVVVSVQFRRESISISFAEVAMVLGLAFCDPLGFVLASVLGSAVGLLRHRVPPLKLLFNLALFAFEAAFARLVYSAVLAGGDPTDVRGFLAAAVTVVSIHAVSAVALTAVVFVTVGVFDDGVLREAMSTALVIGLTNSSVGLLVVLLLTTRPVALVLLLGITGAFVVAYLGYSRLSRGHARLELLYRFTDRIGSAVRTDAVLDAVLREARDVLTAERAELHLLPVRGEPGARLSLGDGEVVRTTAAEPGWWADALNGRPVLRRRGTHDDPDLRDGLAAPLKVADQVVGALLVQDRPHHLDTFTESDVRLFTSLANHAGVTLHKAELVDRLASEAAEQEHRSLHDPVTGLPNRRRFLQVLEAALAADGDDVAVVVLDLDGFTDVNEAFGHGIGDALLTEVGARLAARVADDGVARLGNDEFAVLLREVRSDRAAVDRSRALVEALADGYGADGLGVHLRATAGVARPSASGESASALLQHADTALYAAKQAGRELEVYAPATDGASARLLMTGHLRDSIGRGALDVHFQPKVEAATGRPVGAEALVRWHHPAHGQVSPDAFVPLAEHTGLIRPLTELVLSAALRACAGWREEGWDLGVAVNLSARSLTDVDLPTVVAAGLETNGIPADALTLEITETAVMGDLDRSLTVLSQLRAAGVHLSIDDFGTGQSSLAYLQRLPIDEVKIDKSFVRHLADQREDSAITRAAVDLGHALGLSVVAEGVEDVVAQAMLAGWGCDLVQGFAIGRPMPDQDLRRWLARFPRIETVDVVDV